MDMDRRTFITLFKDLVSRLYDRVTVETHPLTMFFPTPVNSTARPAEIVRTLVQEEIEHLRPDGDELPLSPEWRPYLILKQRYMEGRDLSSIAAFLCIGDRQFRRDHSRALQALSTGVWNKYFQDGTPVDDTGAARVVEDLDAFESHAENLDLNEVVLGVEPIIRRRLEMENVALELHLCATPVSIHTDRVLLRQIILSLLNSILHLHDQPSLAIRTVAGKNPLLQFIYHTDDQWEAALMEEQDALEFIRRLCQRLPARLIENNPAPGLGGSGEMQLCFPGISPGIVLVVDDQDAAQKMFQRYLSQTSLEVRGVTDPAQVIDNVRMLQPVLVILDVMMPHIDGWEILQTLKLEAGTKEIPVLICSAWGDAELARSLGAVAFLKKPVIQKEFLAALSRLGLPLE
jgi:CheY-like chemotaxis protein